MDTRIFRSKTLWILATLLTLLSGGLLVTVLSLQPVSANSLGPNQECEDTWTFYGYEISCIRDSRCTTPPYWYAEISLWLHVDTFCDSTIVREFNACRSTCQAAPQRTNDLQPAPTQPAPSPQGRIVFVAGPQEGDAEIYTLSLDGGRPLNLTQDPASDVSPQWSPDGKTIAFLSNRTGGWEVYRMDADGAHVRQLTQNLVSVSPPAAALGAEFTADYRYLSWSPDGRYLLAELNLERGLGGKNRLALIPADGSGGQTFGGGPFLGPRWSPDGARIAFVTYASRGPSVAVWDAAALVKEGKVKLVGADATPAWQETPLLSWSPDSRLLAVIALNPDLGTYSLRLMSADALKDQSLYTFTGDRTAAPVLPVWMPDGSGLIAADQGRLILIGADGGAVKTLAGLEAPVTDLALSPDGRSLLYSAGAKVRQVYALDVAPVLSGAPAVHPIQLTKDPTLSASAPAWQPILP